MNTNYADTFYSPHDTSERGSIIALCDHFQLVDPLACRMRCATTTTANASAADGTERTVFAISAWHDRERDGNDVRCRFHTPAFPAPPKCSPSYRHHIVARVAVSSLALYLSIFTNFGSASALQQRQYDGCVFLCVFVCAGQSSALKCSRVFRAHGFTSGWWIEIYSLDGIWFICMGCNFSANENRVWWKQFQQYLK